jgi:hypothetical protein
MMQKLAASTLCNICTWSSPEHDKVTNLVFQNGAAHCAVNALKQNNTRTAAEAQDAQVYAARLLYMLAVVRKTNVFNADMVRDLLNENGFNEETRNLIAHALTYTRLDQS